MQVEVKIVLQSESDFAVACESLSSDFISQMRLENHFFDTPELTLLSKGAHLRLRFSDEQCLLALKEHATYESGTATRWAKEVSLSVASGQAIANNPMLMVDSPEVATVVDTLKVHFAPSSLRGIGGFVTNRKTYQWKKCKSQPGLILRLDHTEFPFGHRYEIEVPGIVVPVQDVLEEISESLDSLNIAYSMAQESKLEAFLSGSKAALAKSHLVQDAKLVLKDREAFNLLSSRLRPSFQSQEHQENYFFDGSNNELHSQGAHLRVRIAGGICTAVVKEHQGISDGSSIYWGRQVELTHAVFDEMLRSPSTFLDINSPVAQALKTKFNISNLHLIGSFTNTRSVFDWSSARSQKGLYIHLDHTVFPFGDRFEVEVPNIEVPLSDVIGELSEALNNLGIESYAGTDSKFNVLCSGLKKG